MRSAVSCAAAAGTVRTPSRIPPRLTKAARLAEGLYSPPLNPFADLRRVLVKGTGNPQAEILESLVAQERRSQVAHAYQDRFGLIVPAQEPLDGGDQLGYRKTAPRHSDRAGHCQVFADDNRFKGMRGRQECAGDVLLPFALEHAQHLQVSRQALHAGDARQLHRLGRGCSGGRYRRLDRWRQTGPPLPTVLAATRLCLHRVNLAAMLPAA